MDGAPNEDQTSSMEVNVAFGLVLRKLRKRQGFSQEDLANEAALDRTFISLLENGQRQPSISTIFAVAKPLKTTPSELLYEVEKQLRRARFIRQR